jgi:serine/threonine-protein kinase
MGEPPFDGPSVIDILLKHARQPPPRIERAGLRLPAGLADLTQQMLAKKVQDRPASAALVRDRLGAMLAEVRHSGSENFTEEASQAMPVTLVPEVAPPPPAVQPPPPLPATARQSGAAARPPHAKREGLETWSQDAPDPVEPSGTAPGAGSDELHLHDVAPRKFAAFGGDDGDSEGSTLVGVGLANAIEEVAHRAKSGAVAPKRPSMGQPPAPAHPPATAAPHAPGPPHAAAPPPPGRRAPLGGVGASGVDASSAIQRPSLAGRTVARPPLQGLRQPPAPPAQPPPTFADNTAGRRANPQLHRQPPRAPSNKMPAVEINDRATTAPQIDADPATLQRSAADHDTIAPLAAAGARSNMLLYVAVGVAAIGLIGISVTVWLFTRGG